jgi:C4-type Zn-finger protein
MDIRTASTLRIELGHRIPIVDLQDDQEFPPTCPSCQALYRVILAITQPALLPHHDDVHVLIVECVRCDTVSAYRFLYQMSENEMVLNG